MRILIVEDNSIHSERIIRQINAINRDALNERGVSQFELQCAKSIEGAKTLLNQAVMANTHYDLILLDLELPRHDNEIFSAGTGAGMEVLKFAREKKAALAVIVLTAFSEHMLDSFRLGVEDFVEKKDPDTALEERLLLCLDSVIRRESDRIFSDRLRNLIPYGEQGVAYLFSKCFSALAQAIQIHGSQLREEICERHSIVSADQAMDPMLVNLASLQQASEHIGRQWNKQMEALEIAEEQKPESINLGDLLNSIRDQMRYAFVQKRVKLIMPDHSDLVVSGFSADIMAVLREIALGAIVEIDENTSDPKDRSFLATVTLQPSRGFVDIEWKDNLPPIDHTQRHLINQNMILSPNSRFGRAWGLSIAQHIAVRSRSSIKVVQTHTTTGTCVIFTLPISF